MLRLSHRCVNRTDLYRFENRVSYLLIGVHWQAVLPRGEHEVDEGVPSVEDRVSHGRGGVTHYGEVLLQQARKVV